MRRVDSNRSVGQSQRPAGSSRKRFFTPHTISYESLEPRQLLATLALQDTVLPDAGGPLAGAHFGAAVAMSDAYRVVGAPNARVGGLAQSGQVALYDSSDDLIATIANPTPASSDYFGFSVAVNGDTVVIGAYGDDTGAQAAGSAYVYDVSSGSPLLTATIHNPTPAAFDFFGDEVAVRGDIVVVGAKRDDTMGDDAGSLYVFDLSSGSAVLDDTLHSPIPAADDFYGSALAFSGNTLVVSATGDDTGANGAGSVYVYDFSSGSAILDTTLNNPTPTQSDRFGSDVSVSGGIVVVGAGGDDTGASGAGSAYVYDLSGFNDVLVASLHNPTPALNDFFGDSVAVDGDTVVVGAYWDDTGANTAGSAYIYDLSNGGAVLDATLNNPTPEAQDRFGLSVAVSGDAVMVGAPQDNTGANNAGLAYVYDVSGENELVKSILKNPTATGEFGDKVAVSGNIMVVGAWLDDTGAKNSGRAYVYDLSSGNAVIVATLDNPSPAVRDQFGSSVAVSGDTVVIGAKGDDFGAEDAGRVYVYDISSGTAVLVDTVDNPAPEDDDEFGRAVAISGETLVVGLGFNNTRGTAYVYDLSSTGATFASPLIAPSQFQRSFGSALSIDGDTVVVGSPLLTNTGGIAYVYDLSVGGAAPVATLNHPNEDARERFGYSVSVSGGTAVVSSWPGNDTVSSVHVYDLSFGTDTPVASLVTPNPAGLDDFGRSVAVSGDTLVVGAHGRVAESETGTRGRAYVYDLSNGGAALSATLSNPGPGNGSYGFATAISGDTIAVGASRRFTSNVGTGTVHLYDITETTFCLGDFDFDGDVDLIDLDRYNGNIGMLAAGSDLEPLDLNNNGFVDSDDFEQHYSTLVETLNGGKGTFAGDANLDGQVDVLGDAFILVSNLGSSATSWAQGDFNADGNVDVLGDAFLLVGNLGMNTGGATTANLMSALSIEITEPAPFKQVKKPAAASDIGSSYRVPVIHEPASNWNEKKNQQARSNVTLPPEQLNLAGNQGLDSAFESVDLIESLVF